MGATTTLATPALLSGRQGVRLRPERDRRRGTPSARPTGRRGAPPARPAHPVAAPSLSSGATAAAKGCGDLAPAADVVMPRTGKVRLTDRGIAVILVAGAMIVLAAVTMIALTAITVTGESYQSVTAGQSRPH